MAYRQLQRTISSDPSDPDEDETKEPQIPEVSQVGKLAEFFYLSLTRLQVLFLSAPLVRVLRDKQSSSSSSWSGHMFGPLSAQGLFNSHYIEPMFLWWGMNTRILLGPSIGRVSVLDSYGRTMKSCINGASHNYAGSYLVNEISEAIHSLCLDNLPVTLRSGPMYDTVRAELATFWSADFCIPTTTGYGSNYLALPRLLALLRERGGTVAVFCDSHCHNSIFTGVYLAIGRLGGVTLRRFPHNDASLLEDMLRESKASVKLVVVEGLYSMEGDVPPLPALARLKEAYGFVLYCDEAHSFLSLGQSGRGCFELAKDRGTMCDQDPVDIRTCTLSKAIGGIGGCIAGRQEFASCFADMPPQPVSTATLAQALWLIRQPSLVRRNLARLAATAGFCRRELSRQGVFVYGGGEDATPILPVWTGRSSTSARFSYELRRRGVLASPVTTPAVPFWESRVRVNLSADFDAEDVERLVCTIVDVARATGVATRSVRRQAAKFAPARLGMPGDNENADKSEEEGRGVLESIKTLVIQQSQLQPQKRPCPLTTAGHAARRRYGLASGGSRWIAGTFPSHVAVESLISAAVGSEATMTFQDADVSLASTIAALARPLLGAKRHVMLFPAHPESHLVEDGLLLIPPSAKGEGRLRVVRYADLKDLAHCAIEAGTGQTCLTIYVELAGSTPAAELVRASLSRVARCVGGKTSITVLVRDARVPAATSRPDLVRIDEVVPRDERMHALLFGICASADVEVGYLTGPENLIRELRYTSRGYMYTTSVPPFVMGIIAAALESTLSKESTVY
ncbi:aminotransferase class I and II [Colletotrichum graminicola]|uniref:serine C-palmitoyltransferase n=1 Tax=Colletotrichum graminicola (strain M1.001 / M2 / FGSC 10212) TaxID=645133 RepID=E3QZJ5_COLGM|nr:aminotransferase class I and II [Colletotrichum graminicola M1.001]EFQ36283.1 aminotransferase class I and II [Colletotrichum graminicola M1.001]WDK19604.1 aminotransferase class I and II [Colletotrichum graminicola]